MAALRDAFCSLGPGFLLGEISFLDDTAGASASIRARDEVDVYLLKRSFVKETLTKHPELKGKFYQFLANLMIERMRKL